MNETVPAAGIKKMCSLIFIYLVNLPLSQTFNGLLNYDISLSSQTESRKENDSFEHARIKIVRLNWVSDLSPYFQERTKKVTIKHQIKTKNRKSTPSMGLEPYKANIPDVASCFR
jgi:hypothetical protein